MPQALGKTIGFTGPRGKICVRNAAEIGFIGRMGVFAIDFGRPARDSANRLIEIFAERSRSPSGGMGSEVVVALTP